MLQRLATVSLIFAAATASAGLSAVPSGTYTLDETHGYITFSYSHLGFSNPRVGFNEFETELDLDSENPANSKVSVTINAASIDSRVPVFNEHLNSADWLNTALHPTITFETTGIEATGDNSFDVNGNLTIMGTTRPVTIAATINKADIHPLRNVPAIGISGTAGILRSDWGLDGYVPAVSDEVTISIEVELIKTEE